MLFTKLSFRKIVVNSKWKIICFYFNKYYHLKENYDMQFPKFRISQIKRKKVNRQSLIFKLI